MVPEITVAPAFVAVNEGIFPLPLAPNPIAVLEFVHVNVAPVGVLVNAEAETVAPLHTVILVIGSTVGIGLITTFNGRRICASTNSCSNSIGSSIRNSNTCNAWILSRTNKTVRTTPAITGTSNISSR